MLMINYHTNACNGALVRFNPATRSRATRRLASPRRPPARFQALASLPSHALPSPAPAPASFRTPPPTSTRHHARFRVPAPSPPAPCLGSAAPSACTPNHAWVPQPCPRVRSRRACFRVPSGSAATPFGSKAHFLASFRFPIARPGFSSRPRTQIRPNPPIPMRHNVTLSR